MTDWPHAPPHRLLLPGTYMVTCSTYKKEHHFKSTERLQFLHDNLLRLAKDHKWKLSAWAVMSNHYHFIAQSDEKATTLSAFLSQLHVLTARHVNELDQALNRQVWFQFWESRLTFQYSYLARLNYVIQNPVKHKLVTVAAGYPWCSASRFETNVPKAFRETVYNFKTDKLNLEDDF